MTRFASLLLIAPLLAAACSPSEAPGEAREADVGVAGGRGTGLIFVQGERKLKIEEKEIINALSAEIEAIIKK